MSANEKYQNDNLCKKHSSRCDKDYYRSVCPSKLSKGELEDLYYSLLENNLALKQTINAQNEKNRLLSTKVQRMAAQTKVYGGKDCCPSAKAVINEQKAVILDLKNANEAMADRLRKLSTQLCTAKQFLKQNPSSRHCYRCYVKNASTTSLRNKTSEGNLKSVAASAISLDQEPPPTTRTAETNTPEKEVENDDKENVEKVCNENKCRTVVEDLKQKIADLEEELAKTHMEYSTRIAQLEDQARALRAGAARARSELSLRARDDARGLRHAGADRAELESRLSIEKKKVSELEMRLKSAEFSQQVARTIEVHVATASRLDEKQLRQISAEQCSACSSSGRSATPQQVPSCCTSKRSNELKISDDKQGKSDDSGYADRCDHCDVKNVDKVNHWLTERIAEMQEQLDALKLSSGDKLNADPDASSCCKAYGPCPNGSQDKLECTESANVPKRPQITIVEESTPTRQLSEPKSSKSTPEKNNSAIIKTSRSNNETGKDRHERDVCNLDTCSIQNVSHRSDNSSKEQACCNLKEDDCSNLPKPVCDVCSTSVLEHHIDMINSDAADNVSNTKSEVMQHMFECGKVDRVIEEIISKMSCRNNKEDSNSVCSSNCHTPKPSTIRPDQNTRQITCPLPLCSDSATSKQSNKTGSHSWRKTKFYGKKKGIIVVEDINKINETTKITTAPREGYICSNVKNQKYNKNDDCCVSDNENFTRTYDIKCDRKSKGMAIHTNVKKYGYKGKDHLKTGGCKIITCDLDDSAKMRKPNKMYEFDICHHHATICTCPEDTSEGGITLRSCSGTLLVSTLRAGSRIRRCRCSERTAVCSGGSLLKHTPVGTSTPKCNPRPPSPAAQHTYTVESRCCGPASPDNTDNEISGLTDLPTEKDGSTPRDLLSPGEHKTIETSTESYSYYNEVSLSDGEVPAGKYTVRRMFQSVGEVRSIDYVKEDKSIGERQSSAETMEEALHAISQELARCRALLRRRRPRDLAAGHTT